MSPLASLLFIILVLAFCILDSLSSLLSSTYYQSQNAPYNLLASFTLSFALSLYKGRLFYICCPICVFLSVCNELFALFCYQINYFFTALLISIASFFLHCPFLSFCSLIFFLLSVNRFDVVIHLMFFFG